MATLARPFLLSVAIFLPYAGAGPGSSDLAALVVDDDCVGSDRKSCAGGADDDVGLLHVELLQKRKQGAAQTDDWVALIEGSECPGTGKISCEKAGNWRLFKFPAGVFTVPRQISIPPNTAIEGAANPNGVEKAKKPDYSTQTVFVANEGLTNRDGRVCYCQNLEKSWLPLSRSNPYHCKDLTNERVKSLRKGFLMNSNTVVKNIAFQGKDALRPSDNGALCGGGVFETPGCVHNQCEFPHLMTGDGKPVSNVTIENVRLNDYSTDPKLSSQLALWVAQTTDTQTPTSDVHVKNLVALSMHADGINLHGFVQKAVVEDSYIADTGDDIYVVWGGNFDTRDIIFQNSVAVDAGRSRQNHYGSCVAVYGAKEATFRNLTCFAPEQNTRDCYDPKNRGETCNGCLGIIKESFNADYSGSVFTFTDNKFYALKRTEVNGRSIYDLTDPQPAGRPEVCNNEWNKGGLVVNTGGSATGITYTKLGGVAANEGKDVAPAKYGCNLACCEAYCTNNVQCNSFAWSGRYNTCFPKDAVLKSNSAVTGNSAGYATYIKNRHD